MRVFGNGAIDEVGECHGEGDRGREEERVPAPEGVGEGCAQAACKEARNEGREEFYLFFGRLDAGHAVADEDAEVGVDAGKMGRPDYGAGVGGGHRVLQAAGRGEDELGRRGGRFVEALGANDEQGFDEEAEAVPSAEFEAGVPDDETAQDGAPDEGRD